MTVIMDKMKDVSSGVADAVPTVPSPSDVQDVSKRLFNDVNYRLRSLQDSFQEFTSSLDSAVPVASNCHDALGDVFLWASACLVFLAVGEKIGAVIMTPLLESFGVPLILIVPLVTPFAFISFRVLSNKYSQREQHTASLGFSLLVGMMLGAPLANKFTVHMPPPLFVFAFAIAVVALSVGQYLETDRRLYALICATAGFIAMFGVGYFKGGEALGGSYIPWAVTLFIFGVFVVLLAIADLVVAFNCIDTQMLVVSMFAMIDAVLFYTFGTSK